MSQGSSYFIYRIYKTKDCMGTALITGASAGLGLEFAKIFAKDGHDLILVARRKDVLEQLAKTLKEKRESLRVDILAIDLSQPGAGKDVFTKVQELGHDVDFLVNNAGFGTGGEFSSLPLERELQMMDLNMRTLVELSHLFLPAMKQKKYGKILNVGSTAGFQPGPYMTTYYATKAFVNSFSEGLHEELKGTGVSCTVLTPGATATEFAQTASVSSSRLFKSPTVASASQVAKYGYRAMMKEKAIAIPGCVNWLLVQTVRLTPRYLVRKLASSINR